MAIPNRTPIAERRAELDTRLADARVPQVNAAAAFTRADGLIQEVDALLRERQQQQLLQLDPSPLKPGELGHGGDRPSRSRGLDPETESPAASPIPCDATSSSTVPR